MTLRTLRRRAGATTATRHVAIEPDTGLFTGTGLTQASDPDNHEAVVGLELLDAEERDNAQDLKVLSDSAYGTGDARAQAGHTAITKPGPPCLGHRGRIHRPLPAMLPEVSNGSGHVPGGHEQIRLDILRTLVIQGKQNREIADQLYVTINTVKKQVAQILDKLGATNRTQATTRARELGLLL